MSALDDIRDVVVGPEYPRAPELVARLGAPIGEVKAFTLASQDSAFFKGVRRLDNAITRRRDPTGNRLAAGVDEQSEPASYVRTVWVYVPQQLQTDLPAPFVVVQDGHAYLNTLPKTLDSLIDRGRVPPMLAVLVDSGGGDAQGSQRGLEYDTLSGRYSDFVEAEVLPRVVTETSRASSAMNLGHAPPWESAPAQHALSQWPGFTLTGIAGCSAIQAHS